MTKDVKPLSAFESLTTPIGHEIPLDLEGGTIEEALAKKYPHAHSIRYAVVGRGDEDSVRVDVYQSFT